MINVIRLTEDHLGDGNKGISLLKKCGENIRQCLGSMQGGIVEMYDITVISLVVACLVSLVRKNGGIAYILRVIRSRIHGKTGGEYGIAVLTLLVDLVTANNTIAIVMAGPIAKEISAEYQISPKRTASILDIFASVGQGLIPYGAQMLLAAERAGIPPLQIIPYTFYPMLMGVTVLVFIGLRRGR